VGVEITRNFGPLTDLASLSRDEWGRVGRLARERIIRRTAQGKDIHDQPFRAYSPGYAEQKQKAGASGRVDLQVSGEMLRNISVEPDTDGVTVDFST
jgi:hypothetical protein